ncbi:cytochrome P450 [Massilia sp. B-10]|nr:cytochrome P450 [Massilia sp. B-10]
MPDLIYRFFHLRRQASSPTYAVAPGVQEDLLATGARLDAVLRQHLRRQAGGQCSGAGVLAGLMDPAGAGLSEDEAVGHANILFVSATEPVAVALTWTLLVLSQAPHWREAARNDAGALEGVLLESLRMLPPNTFMSRVATGGAVLGGVELPARTELVISAFAEHRDGAVFADPDTFMPQRWRSARPVHSSSCHSALKHPFLYRAQHGHGSAAQRADLPAAALRHRAARRPGHRLVRAHHAAAAPTFRCASQRRAQARQ